MNLSLLKFIILPLSITMVLFSLAACNTSKMQNAGQYDKNMQEREMPLDIAIMMPISGENAEFYKELSLMVKLGLADGAKTQVRVTTYDTTNKVVLGDSIKAILGESDRAGGDKAVTPEQSKKSDIVIGPIFSGTTTTVSEALIGHHIPILTLSNNPVLAREDVFVLGHAPMKQTETLVNKLLSFQYNNFIILLPNGRHSESVTNVIKDMIEARGGAISRVLYYNSLQEDIAIDVKLIADDVDNLNEIDLNLRKPVILIGDDERNLSKIYDCAARYDLDKKAVIAGDSRINIASSHGLDITYTGSVNERLPLIKAKAATFGIKHLGFLHEVAYDAGYIAGIAAGSKYDYATFLANLKMINKNRDGTIGMATSYQEGADIDQGFVVQDEEPLIQYKGLSGKIYFIDSISQRDYTLISKKGSYKRTPDQHRASPVSE